jgi:hypothetical protein
MKNKLVVLAQLQRRSYFDLQFSSAGVGIETEEMAS